MSATPLTADISIDVRAGVQGKTPAKATASTAIYLGSLVNRTTSTGFCLPAADSTGVTFAGIAATAVASATGNTVFEVFQKGDYLLKIQSTATEATVGLAVYVYDDNSVDLTANVTNHVKVGTVVEFVSANLVRVRIDGNAA